MEWVERKVLADKEDIGRMLRRIAHEIVERNSVGKKGATPIALVGIRTGGHYLAERLHRLVSEIENVDVPLGSVDITLYRDDLLTGMANPEIGPTELRFALTDMIIVLVDDVLYTGRTVRAALDAIMDFGRPRAVQLAALVDRGHRELPIRADYTGLTVETSLRESIKVQLSETDGSDRVVLRENLEDSK